MVIDVVQTHVLSLLDPHLRVVRTLSLKSLWTLNRVAIGSSDAVGAIADFTIKGNDIAVLVDLGALGSQAELALGGLALEDGLPGALHELELLALTTDPLEVLKVLLVDRSDVLAAEDTDLKLLLRLVARRERSASGLQVGEALVDDSVCANLLRDFFSGAVVSNEL